MTRPRVILCEILPPISPLLTTSICNAIKSKLQYKSAVQRTPSLVQYTVISIPRVGVYTGAMATVDSRRVLYFPVIFVKNRIFEGEILHLSLLVPVNSKSLRRP